MKVTVFIPTYNSERYLSEILDAISAQEVDFEFDILIYDSESSDRTHQILDDYAQKLTNLKWKEIKKATFSHGRTRQEAALEATGDVIVYLTDDAMPATKHWLRHMVAPFSISDRVAGVVGRQIPRSHCVPMLKHEIQYVFDVEQGVPDAITLYQREPEEATGVFTKKTFYSDVNSAVKRDFLINTIGYADVPYSEDQQFGRDIIDAGYIKVYSGVGAVIHSNDVELKHYKNRLFDEVYNMRKLSGKTEKLPFSFVMKQILVTSWRDGKKIMAEKNYSFKTKLYWLYTNPKYIIAKWQGLYLGYKVDLNDRKSYLKYSLERKEENQA